MQTLIASPAMRARLGLAETVAQPQAESISIPQPKPTKDIDAEVAAWRRERLEQRNALILALRRLAPQLFGGLERDHPPLAIGIDKEIREQLHDVNRNILADVLRAHVSGPGYLKRLAVGEPRRHLDGSEAGSPSPGDMIGARARLEALQARRKAKAAPVPAAVAGDFP
jgi:sRNA-binding protein